MKQQRQLLPYFVVLAFATIFVQALMYGFDTSGMEGVFIAAAVAFGSLGLIAGTIWSPNLLIASLLASIPTWLFMFALHRWSVIETLTRTVEGIPVVLEPVSVSVFFCIGAWIGVKLSRFWHERKTNNASTRVNS
jgi:hypothetical protein